MEDSLWRGPEGRDAGLEAARRVAHALHRRGFVVATGREDGQVHLWDAREVAWQHEREDAMPTPRTWTEAATVTAVQAFQAREGRWPTRQDFCPAMGLPSLSLVNRRMGTWQEPVRVAQRGEAQTSWEETGEDATDAAPP